MHDPLPGLTKKNQHDDTFSSVFNEDNIMDEVLSFLVEKGVNPLATLSKDEAEALYTLGHNYYQQGNYQEAVTLFEWLCRHSTIEGRYLKALGAACQMIERYKTAINAYGLAAVLDIEDPEPSIFACECLLHLSEFDRAKQAYEAAEMQMEKLRPEREDWKEKMAHLNNILSFRQNTKNPKKGQGKASHE